MEIDVIITALKGITDAKGMECSDDMILDCATRIYNSEQINKSKLQQPPVEVTGDMATEPQKKLLRQLGFRGNPNVLSKREASDAISALK